jgi:hypothetical protein
MSGQSWTLGAIMESSTIRKPPLLHHVQAAELHPRASRTVVVVAVPVARLGRGALR